VDDRIQWENIMDPAIDAWNMGDVTEEAEPRFITSMARGGSRFEQRLRQLADLCGIGYESAVARLEYIHEYFCRHSAVLLLEKEEDAMLEPAASLLTIGRTVVLNFHQGVKGAD